MNTTMKFGALVIFLLLVVTIPTLLKKSKADDSGIMIVNLNDSDFNDSFNILRTAFVMNNPGYDVEYLKNVNAVAAREVTQVVFVQAIDGETNQDVEARATLTESSGSQHLSELSVGDIIILQKGDQVISENAMGFLVFHIPVEPEQELPGFIRPDWDPLITDTPGGCATEIDAYRRILLTWRKEVGPYIYHALNAHRVRITDSFSHYHPIEHGFDEFYLVQMVKPGAKLITSSKTEIIIRPEDVQKSQVGGLVHERELDVGDLVYIPRGVMHRGYGGVLAQVITVPGFIPGAEIGVDHHLRAINERLNLSDSEALPYQVESSLAPVIR
jgi:hypothetical protein